MQDLICIVRSLNALPQIARKKEEIVSRLLTVNSEKLESLVAHHVLKKPKQRLKLIFAFASMNQGLIGI